MTNSTISAIGAVTGYYTNPATAASAVASASTNDGSISSRADVALGVAQTGAALADMVMYFT